VCSGRGRAGSTAEVVDPALKRSDQADRPRGDSGDSSYMRKSVTAATARAGDRADLRPRKRVELPQGSQGSRAKALQWRFVIARPATRANRIDRFQAAQREPGDPPSRAEVAALRTRYGPEPPAARLAPRCNALFWANVSRRPLSIAPVYALAYFYKV
jgi:hypothetical protein